jgi:hypothetical protein
VGVHSLPDDEMAVDRPTCGKGLAETAALPAKLAELVDSVAEVLEIHMEALDLSDAKSRQERDAYRELVGDQRKIAADLQATARRMAGDRDLPMGRHDESAMAGPKPVEAFERFVTIERELVTLLQKRLERDHAMLRSMGGGSST